VTRAGYLASIVFVIPVVAYAQPAESPEPAKADSPAPEPEAEQKAVAPVTSTSELVDKEVTPPKFSWEPFGYLRLQYVFVQNDPNVAFIGRDDGFELQNARVGVRGDLQNIARFTISIDGAVDERERNTPEGTLRVGLRDAYADLWLGGDLMVRGGFFETWVDPQSLVADTQREFIDKPLEIRGVRSTQGFYTPGLPPGRSIGAAVRLEPEEANKIGFELAVQNGADEFSSNNDNDKPAVSAAAMLRLANNGFLVAAARWNPRTVGMLPFRQDETDLQGSVGAQVNAGMFQLGAGAIVQRTTYESTNGPVQNAFGAHGQLMVKLGAERPVSVGYRFAILDPSSLIVTDRVMEHTAGALIAVPQWRMRLQLSATHVQEQAARALSNSRLQLAAEVSL
jgi:hypothetical protein